jgi:uncharacterized OsmC-like protein
MGKPTLRYTVEAATRGGGLSSARTRQATIEVDTSAGQSATHMGPADLLATAFAACVLKNVERFSGILPFRYDGASISVTAEREDRPPRISQIQYVLRIRTDEPAQRVDLLRRNIEKFGTIFNTLAAACRVTGEIVAEPPGARTPDVGSPGAADVRTQGDGVPAPPHVRG